MVQIQPVPPVLCSRYISSYAITGGERNKKISLFPEVLTRRKSSRSGIIQVAEKNCYLRVRSKGATKRYYYELIYITEEFKMIDSDYFMNY